MKNTEVTCPTCSRHFEIRYHRKLRILAAGTGALFGAAISDGIIGAVLIGGVSYAAARAIDSYLARRCRVCGTIVELPSRPDVEQPPAEAQAA
jgi:hypothetical protein